MGYSWERQPHETNKSFSAFQEFLNMPVYGSKEERRTLQNLADKLGYKSSSTIEDWSAKYEWMVRAAAYDAHMGNALVEVKESSLREAQQFAISRLQLQMVLAGEIIQKALLQLKERLDDPDKEVDPMDIARLMNAIKTQDDLNRRAVSLPTSFRSTDAEDIDEDAVFIIGGG